MSRNWFKHGFWNTLEHGLTRGLDAATMFVLIRTLPMETFSQLAMAQAWVAPTLILFVSPETVLYRDYANWRSRGIGELAARLRALRLFGWGKAQAALVVALVVSLFFPYGPTWTSRLAALIWAYALVLAPQIAGADREYLRIDLQLRRLNLLTLSQKILILTGTLAVAYTDGTRIERLTLVAIIAAVVPALFARSLVVLSLRKAGASAAEVAGREGPSPVATLQEALGSFSLWQHLAGVVHNWIQTLDLFLLGLFGAEAGVLVRYAAVLKVANLASAVPLAFSNLFSVWMGRRLSTVQSRQVELATVDRSSAGLFLVAALVGGGLILGGPYVYTFLSHGRWSTLEVNEMLGWSRWIIAGSVLLSVGLAISSWLTLRSLLKDLFLRVYLVWGALAALIYGLWIWSAGAHGAAAANVGVGLVWLALLWVQRRRVLR